MPQLSAIWHTTRRARRLGVPVIADGGITYSGDIVKAIAAGAETRDARLAARRHRGEPRRDGAVRGPPLQELPRHGLDGRDAGPRRRPLRQRASRSAVGAATRKLVPEGIEGRVAYAGPLGDVVYQLVGGLRSGMGYAGAATLESLRTGARFMRVTTAGREESHPHDVHDHQRGPQLPTRRLTIRVFAAIGVLERGRPAADTRLAANTRMDQRGRTS